MQGKEVGTRCHHNSEGILQGDVQGRGAQRVAPSLLFGPREAEGGRGDLTDDPGGKAEEGGVAHTTDFEDIANAFGSVSHGEVDQAVKGAKCKQDE